MGGNHYDDCAAGGINTPAQCKRRVSWQNSWTSSTFTTPNSVPFTDFSSIGDWTHQLNTSTAVIPSVNYEQLNYGGPSQTELKLWRFFLGVSYLYPGRFNLYAFGGRPGCQFVIAADYQSQSAQSNSHDLVAIRSQRSDGRSRPISASWLLFPGPRSRAGSVHQHRIGLQICELPFLSITQLSSY